MARARRDIPYTDPLTAFAPFKDQPHALLLHGAGAHPQARWSFAAPDPKDPLVIADKRAPDAIMQAMRALLRPYRSVDDAPFTSGFAGFFAYEFGALFEPAMPQRAPDGPFAALARHETIIAFDHHAQRAFVTGPDDRIVDEVAQVVTSAPAAAPAPADGRILAMTPAGTFAAQVDAVRAHIRAGDVFQANISRAATGLLGRGCHPYDFFRRLQTISPAPFSAYLRLPGAAIVSNSPERLARAHVDRDGRLHAQTAPIKGTRPRGADAEEDRRLIQALLASEKERAENLMIVDLMRNDFARVAAAGTVRVPGLFDVETFANVHHLVSRVTATLLPDRDAFDLLRSVFPAGSITGAPKIMAMTIIDALEGAARSANYGGIGWFGDDGAMDLNVSIRTATCEPEGDDWRVSFRVGGGITIDSDPWAEAAETDAKARSLIAAMTGVAR